MRPCRYDAQRCRRRPSAHRGARASPPPPSPRDTLLPTLPPRPPRERASGLNRGDPSPIYTRRSGTYKRASGNRNRRRNERGRDCAQVRTFLVESCLRAGDRHESNISTATQAEQPTTGVQRRAPPHVYLNAPLLQRAPCARRRGGSCAALGRAADRSGGRRGEQRTHKIMRALASIAAHTTSLGTRGIYPPRLPGHWIHYHRDVI